jgi:hypothetical protein
MTLGEIGSKLEEFETTWEMAPSWRGSRGVASASKSWSAAATP